MSIQIIGSFQANKLYCAGSTTKFLTAYVCLSLLAENYELKHILDDDNFLNQLAKSTDEKDFLHHFQKMVGGKFSIRDLCTYYTGLPYTFDITDKELSDVEKNGPFKHHSILDEETFLYMCKNKISPVYTNRCKFHYSEISIIFLGYFIEKIYKIKMEDLYHQYIIDKFKLSSSTFSRYRPNHVFCEDLSDSYDYASIAILDHGYFCYSNGYYTTLNDMKTLLENLLEDYVFKFMIDITHARAVSNRLMNGLAIEIRLANDDILIGYEGLSFSGCNLWAYSTKSQRGYITFSNNEETIYDEIYQQLGYVEFDIVPTYSQVHYLNFLKNYHDNSIDQSVPSEYRGNYRRVRINDKELNDIFIVTNNSITIRYPRRIQYQLIYLNGDYRIKNKDHTHGAKVSFCHSKNNNKYMCFDGILYRKIHSFSQEQENNH